MHFKVFLVFSYLLAIFATRSFEEIERNLGRRFLRWIPPSTRAFATTRDRGMYCPTLGNEPRLNPLLTGAARQSRAAPVNSNVRHRTHDTACHMPY